jgi:murein DD-endopeptidase MepM/ murein hydrolase activator NlpD
MHHLTKFGSLWILLALFLSACGSSAVAQSGANPPEEEHAAPEGNTAQIEPAEREAVQAPATAPEASLFANHPTYEPGELVAYTAQTGDSLTALAKRFNTRVEEILAANEFIPASATTMPPGMPMQIPIYYLPFWGLDEPILPDGLFVNGPAQVGFDTAAFIASQPGWLAGYSEYAANANRTAAEIIDLVALKFSVSPRVLLTLIEYQSAGLTNPDPSEYELTYPVGYQDRSRQGLYRQILWAANQLNNGYYAWRTAELLDIETSAGRLFRFDPWMNAATVSLQNYFNLLLPEPQFAAAIAPDGYAAVYRNLFGDPWQANSDHIPGSLEQPSLKLPFEPGKRWAYTGGPHTAWGNARPYSAIDFAPPLSVSGCTPTDEWATAVADGVVVRVDVGELVLDLDSDGDERTGWVIFYLHVASEGRAPLGAVLRAGDPVGHPSCEGGTSTGTHVHIARKYNGEWIPADGVLAFNMEGWVAHNGPAPYLGTLTRLSQTVTACECSNSGSFIESGTP